MRKVSFLVSLVVIIITFSSCKKEGCTDPSATNYDPDAKKSDESCIYKRTEPTYEVPTTYTFEREGVSSVSFSGQTQRMDMLSEMTTYMKTANTPGIALDADKLKNMYANNASPFGNVDLNSSTKQLKNKTAGDDASIQAIFESYMDRLAAISKKTTNGNFDGANGKAGVVQSGSKAYLFDSNGVEYTQYIEKGLMAAVFYHQITNVYLGNDKMAVNDSDLVEGKNYTAMEHHWDEAFGYFTDSPIFPKEGTSRFWGKYCNARDEELGCNKILMDAFLKGRAAVTQRDYLVRDVQRKVIRKELEKVVIATAINYLKAAKSNLADDALRNHELSEAVQFIEAIKYGYEPAFTRSEVDALIAKIGDNFYNVKLADMDEVIKILENKLVAIG